MSCQHMETYQYTCSYHAHAINTANIVNIMKNPHNLQQRESGIAGGLIGGACGTSGSDAKLPSSLSEARNSSASMNVMAYTIGSIHLNHMLYHHGNHSGSFIECSLSCLHGFTCMEYSLSVSSLWISANATLSGRSVLISEVI